MHNKPVVLCTCRPKGFIKYYSFIKKRKLGPVINILMQFRFSRFIYKFLFKRNLGIISKNQRVYDESLIADAINNVKIPKDVHFVGEIDHPFE